MTQPCRRYLPEEELYIRHRLEAGDRIVQIAKAIRRSPSSVKHFMCCKGIPARVAAVNADLARDIVSLHAADPRRSDRYIAAELGCRIVYVRFVLDLPCSTYRKLYGPEAAA